MAPPGHPSALKSERRSISPSFDDGSGAALYAANGHLSKWDGVEWTPVGPGPTGGIWALAPFEDNGAAALYAGRHLHYRAGQSLGGHR